MKFNKTLSCVLLTGLSLAVLNCVDHNIENDTLPENLTFAADVLPIFKNNCALSGCHDGKVRFSLKTYADIRAKVTPSDPTNSLIYRVITGTGPVSMPPSGSLPDSKIDVIEKWIMDGAQEN